jgi:hypothetical protein
MAYKFNISQGEELLLKAASIGAAVLGIVAVYNFYRNNIWKPKILVKTIDYDNTYAELEINNRPFILKGDSAYLIDNEWGIKFGFTPRSDGKRYADRIEILKKNLVQDVIKSPNEMAFTGFDEKTFWNDAFDSPKGGFVAVPRSFTGDENAIVNEVWGVKDSDSFSIFKNK